MVKIIDLSVFKKEPTVIKISEKESFEISGDVSTEFTIGFMKQIAQINEIEQSLTSKDNDVNEMVLLSEKLIERMKETALFIIKQDEKKKDIDMKYVEKHLKSMNDLKAIIEIASNHIKGIESDPN